MIHGLPGLAAALQAVAATLSQDTCWLYEGRFHFPVGGLTLAISAESAGRLRLDVCVAGEPRDTLWILAGEHERLTDLVLELATAQTSV